MYRIVEVKDFKANIFTLVKDHISQDDMLQQSIAVVSAENGVYILNTQEKPDAGEPQHQLNWALVALMAYRLSTASYSGARNKGLQLKAQR